MKLLPDDPKLTAYALGELDAAEHAEVEAALKHSPECRQAVEEIKQLSGMLTKELAAEPCPSLREEQREAVLNGAPASGPASKTNEKIVPFPQRRAAMVALAALAACLVVMVGLNFMGTSGRERTSNIKTAEIAPSQSTPLARVKQRVTSEALGDLASDATPPQASDLTRSLVSPSGNKVWLYEKGGANLDLTGSAAVSTDPTRQRVAILDMQGGIKEITEFSKAPNGTITWPEKSDGKTFSVGFIDGAAPAASPSPSLPASETLGRIKPAAPVASGAPAQAGDKARLIALMPAQANPKPTMSSGPAPVTPAASPASTSAGMSVYEAKAVGYVDALSVNGGRPALTIVDNDSEFGFNTPNYAVIETPALQVSDTYQYGEKANRAQIARQEKEIEQLAQVYNPQHPKYQAATKKLADLKQEQVQLRFVAVPESTTTASYPRYYENPFVPVTEQPLSTFSVDVDTASYANVRRFLNAGQLPPPDAVRIEELVNYFSYNYPQPKGNDPFSASIETATCPWNGEHRLLRVALKGREMAREKRPASNFVFLIDVSGSMEPQERLPLIKQGLRMLVKKMNAGDRVAIVVYASNSGLVLASTSCEQKEKILEAIERLEAGGSTNGGEGIQRAYDVASQNFIKGGINRVILCTDGDFNVGITDQGQLLKLIQDKARSGVFLTTLGVGTDNLKDALMQKLADKGNGNYHYLDSVEEAHKVLVEQMNGTLVTIAKDVKIQIEFNPAQVQSYRLIGYEKRMLKARDFNDDAKDAGEIGAGHTVTALYEVVPAGAEIRPVLNDLKYQSTAKPERYVNNGSREMLTLKLRYKQPEGTESKLLEFPYTSDNVTYRRASTDFKFATAVASFGMILRNSEFKAGANLDNVLELAQEAKGTDEQGYRAEFINLVKKAKALGK